MKNGLVPFFHDKIDIISFWFDTSPMHPYSKLRCESCLSTFEPCQCGQTLRDCDLCATQYHCPLCGASAHYASLNNIEKEQLLHIVKYANQFEHSDSIMEDISMRLSSTFWFNTTHPIIEACLNALPNDEKVVRAYLEHIYTQIYEEVFEEANEYHHGSDW